MSSASQKTLCPGLPRLVVLALLVVLIVMAGCKLTVKTATRSQPAPLVRVLQKVPLIGGLELPLPPETLRDLRARQGRARVSVEPDRHGDDAERPAPHDR